MDNQSNNTQPVEKFCAVTWLGVLVAFLVGISPAIIHVCQLIK